ncbi:hypothetical protein [Amycolatopsis azurea]|uniref:hypothetical protein n=1 Tax=Amycolatopsis azurea TaxID=36819 RepID=UPI001FD77A65|nr:hypothetical protein [Amycolatopsis azurea]
MKKGVGAMGLDMLTRKSLSLFSAVGGWRTVAEGVASRALFLVAYLATARSGSRRSGWSWSACPHCSPGVPGRPPTST